MKTLSSFAALASLSILGCFATGCSANSNEAVAADTANVEASTLVYQHDAPTAFTTVGGREADRVLLKVFADGYRKSTNECDANLSDPKIVPGINGKIAGSFTGVGRNETLYVISVYDCEASHADGYGNTHFVVTEPIAASGDVKVLANATNPGVATGVNRVLDLDGDGQKELVITDGWAGQGYAIEHPSIVRFAGNNLAKDEAFEAFRTQLAATSNDESPFFTDSCGTGNDGANIVFASVHASKTEGRLSFSAQKGTKPCPK